MTKVAVVFAEGFEEIEALSPVDVFRRAGFDCNMLGLESASVTGSHGIQVAMDGVFDGNFTDYDLVVLPGGMPGSTNLQSGLDCLSSRRCKSRKICCCHLCGTYCSRTCRLA